MPFQIRGARGGALSKVLLIFVAMVVMLTLRSGAQEKRDVRRPDLYDYTLPDRKELTVPQQPVVALESKVDPEKYYVGPSDIIEVSIWMSPPQNYPLMVTPEGTLIIPTVGEVAVADITLARAKEKILAEVRKKYISPEVTATLVKPRPIVVSVIGRVLNPGLYTLNSVDRTNKAVDEANKLNRTQTAADLKDLYEVVSTRNIILKHRDGTQDRVDLQKYYATRDERWNPYLREGDIIVVPKKDKLNNVVAVYGEVNTNGRIEYVRGDSLTDAIRIANGLTARAMGDQAIFSRLSEDGKSLQNRTINLDNIIAGREPNIALEPGDRVIVRTRVVVGGDFNVDVKGAVRYPGTYPITANKTHLTEIIQQVGGFAADASLAGARVLRQTLPLEEKETERLLNLRGEIGTEDSLGFSFETELRTLREAVNVDFEKLFMQHDTTLDIILMGEDQVLVPLRTQTVYVFGQVASPGHVQFVSGRDARYYVEKSGGFTDRAGRGDLKVIKSKTKQWLSPGDTSIEEGDYIWVPAAPDRPFSYYAQVTSQMATVISVIIGIGILIVQVAK